jgi:hypothetical protein
VNARIAFSPGALLTSVSRQQEQVMKKTFYTLGLATILLTGVAAGGFAATENSGNSMSDQKAAETQTGNQVGTPSGGVMPNQTRANTTSGTAYSGGASTTGRPQMPTTTGTGEAGGNGTGSGGNGAGSGGSGGAGR